MTYVRTECAHHGPVRQVWVNDGLLVKIWRRLRGPGRKLRAVHWPDSIAILAPASGDAYSFNVTIGFIWCVTGHELEERLAEHARDHRLSLIDRVAARAREASRKCVPFDAASAEREIGRAIMGIFSSPLVTFVSGHDPNGTSGVGQLRAIDPSTMVRLDKPVLSNQREAWDKRQAAVNEHDLASLLAGQLTQRREIWHEFLKAAEKEWHSPYAVALSKDPDVVANVVRKMFDDRLAQVKEMTSELVSQVEEYGTRDTFELMTQNDTVLRRMMALLKIPDTSDPPMAAFGVGEDGSPNGSGPG
jgi:hypothetical protein